ncbi:hypothetical protein COOONC_19309, partial [Cooperia oncophora]
VRMPRTLYHFTTTDPHAQRGYNVPHVVVPYLIRLNEKFRQILWQGSKQLPNATDERHRVLITGALGQLGRGLNTVYKYMYGDGCVVMTDIIKAPRNATDISNYSYLDILSQDSIERLVVDKHIDTVVHFSALLSAVGEQNVNTYSE